jgi:hypothetical protein
LPVTLSPPFCISIPQYAPSFFCMDLTADHAGARRSLVITLGLPTGS